MKSDCQVKEFSQFLQNELTVSSAEIDLVMQKRGIECTCSHVALAIWFGIAIRIKRVFDWLEQQY